MKKGISFNDKVQLILADVDHTIAETYAPAEPEMIKELSMLLSEGRVLFLVTGGGLPRVRERIVDRLPVHLRNQVLVAHCSGAEVWGFKEDGGLRDQPFYTLYDNIMSAAQKKRWREIVAQLITEFHLEVYEPMPKAQFVKKYGTHPLTIMMEDRGPQITFEVENGYELTPAQEKALEISVPITHGTLDLRIPILERGEELFKQNNIPVTPKLGGVSAVDFALEGVSKTSAVKYLLEHEDILKSVGLKPEIIDNPEHIEIWGDRFDRLRGGTDRHMQEAVSKDVRAIDFREEDPDSFLPGYNIVLWEGERRLQDGLLEYLTARKRN